MSTAITNHKHLVVYVQIIEPSTHFVANEEGMDGMGVGYCEVYQGSNQGDEHGIGRSDNHDRKKQRLHRHTTLVLNIDVALVKVKLDLAIEDLEEIKSMVSPNLTVLASNIQGNIYKGEHQISRATFSCGSN